MKHQTLKVYRHACECFLNISQLDNLDISIVKIFFQLLNAGRCKTLPNKDLLVVYIRIKVGGFLY